MRGDDRMSIFPTKILLTTDGSEDSELAATTAVGLAKATGSELNVVTVAEEYPHYEAYRPLAKRSRQLAQEVLDEQLKKIENLAGTIDQTYLRMGRAAQEVVSLAEELGVGLVVIGSRGRGRMRRLLMGSVSDSVVRHAHCPVFVVRWKPVVFPAKILLATDGSEEATLAASTVAELVRSTGSELQVVTVAPEGPYVYAYYDVRHPEEVKRLQQRVREEVLDQQVDLIREAGGTAAKAHLRTGSRGLSGMRRALMGSVSDSVVRHAHCPVMVIRE
jgi:nucleotide-binding universal stress UspA family protein